MLGSLNQWLRRLGYQWVDGKEELMKGNMTEGEAHAIITQLASEGKVTQC